MKNCLLITLSIFFVLSHNWAQPPVSQTTEKLEVLASDNIEKYDTWNALELYMKIYERKKDDPKSTYDVAFTYFLLRDYKYSEEWFKKVLDIDNESLFKISLWYYAYSMKLNGKYKECIPVYEQFQKEYNGAEADRMKAWAQIEIEGAKWAQQVGTKSYEELRIANVGREINSPLMENFAYPIERNKMIFSSLRSDTIIFVDKVEAAQKTVRIFEAERDDQNSAWRKADEFNPEILSSDNFHCAHPTFNAEMSKFYFVRAKLTGNMLENSKIYFATYDGTKIGQPSSLDFNNNAYSCKNPTIAKIDGKEYLYFSSNMPGGKGGFDIWYAEINPDGSTRQPLNLDAVNSVADDSYPYFDSRDNNLYFASTGHPGLGGIDMFTCQLDPKTGSWGKVNNMGPGFNTSLDEFGFILNRIGKDDCYGYFISNREGTTTLPDKKTSTDDVFSILMPERCDVELGFTLTDKVTGQPINGATVQLVEKGSGKVIDEQTNTNGNTFNFTLSQGKEYEIVSKKEGWEADKKLYVDARREALISRFGSTDNPMSWNEKNVMVELGMIVETYNKKTNEPISGVKVTVFNNDNNTVMKENISETNRHEFKISRNNDVRIQARLNGYVGDRKVVSKSELKTVQKLYLTPPPIFINVYFDFDKFNIRPGADDTLNQVATILEEHPELVVEVRGHTDSRGTNAYNDVLAVNRSNSAIKYLLDKGISQDRMIPKGFGENEPVAPNEDTNGNDDPAGRQMNRRVEFKIIKAATDDAEISDIKIEVEEKKK